MPTMTINMVTCLKRIRKAWDKKLLAVQNGDPIGSHFINARNVFNGRPNACALAYAFQWEDNRMKGEKNAITDNAEKGNKICIDLLSIEIAHFGGEASFRKCLVGMEKKYGLK